MKKLKEAYSKGWRALVKIDKYPYDEKLLGPEIFTAGMANINRVDFSVKNEDGFLLKCTIYLPQDMLTQSDIPCVMFLHTRGGCRAEGMFLKNNFLPKTALCVFDFAGSGKSEGEYLSLGPKEKRDARLVVSTIKRDYKVGPIFLWGRSMGAVTSILYAKEHPTEITGLVLDAPFSELETMVKDLVTAHRKIPRCCVGCILGCMLKTVKKKTGNDLSVVKPIDWVEAIKLPVFFIVGKEDNLAKPTRVKSLFDKYGGENKQFFLVEGTHQSSRDAVVVQKAVAFALKTIADQVYRFEQARSVGNVTDVEKTKMQFLSKSEIGYNALDESDPSLLNLKEGMQQPAEARRHQILNYGDDGPYERGYVVDHRSISTGAKPETRLNPKAGSVHPVADPDKK